jgi:FtsP/CotA-like multicopper oxidase with cupredoxin domain
MNRRDLMKWGLASGAAFATGKSTRLWADKGGSGGGSGKSGSGSGSDGGSSGSGSGGSGRGGGNIVPGGNRVPDNLRPSPPTKAFLTPMPTMPLAQPVNPTTLTGAACDDLTAISPEDCIQRSAHQYYNQYHPVKYYELFEQEVMWDFTPASHDLPKSPIWAFNGSFPGPTFVSNYGQPAMVRIHNSLPPVSHLGFGIPSTSTHLHNGHTASESDGFPGDFVNSGQFHDHHYPHCLPGFTTTGEDKAETLGTLWYHDHRMDFTAQNTYAGLVGYHLLYDDKDCGDETNGNGFRLPSGKYDVPLIFADRAFDPNTGIIFFDLLNLDGMLGDKYLVNGVIQPYMQVEARKYRFRFLGVGPSRFWEFHLSDDSYMYQIGEDGNLFTQPIPRQGIRQGVAERTDVIIDFSKYKPGTILYLQNRLEQMNGRGPTGNILSPGDPLLQFRVIPAVGKDTSLIPSFMRAQPAVNLNEVVANRTFRIERSNGGWAINGNFFDVNRIDAHVKRNTAEIWTLQNNSGSWSHPVHIHFEEFRILNRNGAAPPANELGRKDVIKLGPNESVSFFMRFRDWTGRYPMHCHNTVHEDHSMMIRWELEP